MTERPILMSAPMVRALLDGRKTQTRRVVKPQFDRNALPAEMPNETPEGWQTTGHSGRWWCDAAGDASEAIRCPYGIPGDRLWVKETFAKVDGQTQPWIATDYRATYKPGDRMGDLLGIKKRWTPSIFMPREASRITLEVTRVRVQRLQEISERDAQAEGLLPLSSGPDRTWTVEGESSTEHEDARSTYACLWDALDPDYCWDSNPWVWAVSFKVIHP